MQPITITFSKWKIGLLFLGNLFYVVMGLVLLMILPPIGLLFLVWAIWYARLLFRRFTGAIPGLLIDNEGIENNSQWFSLGKVAWKDIKAIKTGRVFFFHRVINIELRYPALILNREKNTLKRWGLMLRTITLRKHIEIRAQLLSKSHDQIAKILSDIDLENPNFEDFSAHLIE